MWPEHILTCPPSSLNTKFINSTKDRSERHCAKMYSVVFPLIRWNAILTMETSDSILNILREELVSLDRIYKKYIQMPKAYLESCLRTTHSSTFAKALSTVFTFLSQQQKPLIVLDQLLFFYNNRLEYKILYKITEHRMICVQRDLRDYLVTTLLWEMVKIWRFLES